VTRRRLLLLVDDSESELELMRHYLAGWANRVVMDFARNGREAVECLARSPRVAGDHPEPALVIIDQKMPLMDGIEATSEIRRMGFDQLPIVMWSGSVDPGDVRRAYAAGVTSYLRKPTGAAEATAALQTLVRYWLDLHCPG
jgi:two-component system sensor histidine kinase/response regulator